MQFGKFVLIASRGLFYLFSAVLLGVASLSIASFLGQDRTCELLSHFRPVFFLVLLVLTGSLLVMRAWKMALLGACVAFVNFLPLVAMYAPREPVPRLSALKIMQMNVHGGKNSNYQSALSLINELSPDVIGFSEITVTWAERLKTNLKEYKFQTIEPHHGGIALFSKLPLSNSEVKYTGKIKRPRITTEVLREGSKFSLVFAHPVTPLHSFQLRNQELSAIAEEASKCNSFVLVGDLNCTPWSYCFEKLKHDGGLKDSMPGFGIQASWNTALPVLPIDHCLVSKNIVTLDRRVCRDIGSDHFPVYVELGFMEN